MLANAGNLKVIGRAGIGVDNIDVPAATARGMIVMNTPFGNSITTAEHAIAMMMALARQLPEADRSTQAGKWEKSRFMGAEVTAKTLGRDRLRQYRLDRRRPRPGLAMKVIAYRSVPHPRARRASWASKKSSSTISCAAPTSSPCTRR